MADSNFPHWKCDRTSRLYTNEPGYAVKVKSCGYEMCFSGTIYLLI